MPQATPEQVTNILNAAKAVLDDIKGTTKTITIKDVVKKLTLRYPTMHDIMIIRHALISNGYTEIKTSKRHRYSKASEEPDNL